VSSTNGRKISEAIGQPLYVVHILSRSEFTELERKSVETSEAIGVDEIIDIARKIVNEAVDPADSTSRLSV